MMFMRLPWFFIAGGDPLGGVVIHFIRPFLGTFSGRLRSSQGSRISL